jgi:predicted HAD superfamily Cof-like phosphohydrolase
VTTIRDQVSEFHKVFGQPVLDKPQVPDSERVQLRLKLISEEFLELLEACSTHTHYTRHDAIVHQRHEIARAKEIVSGIIGRVHQQDVDLVEFVDALADLDYVIEGSRLEFGVDGGPVAAEVHRSNIAKAGPGSTVREDGKIQKPPNWTPPDIEGELRKQGWVKT